MNRRIKRIIALMLVLILTCELLPFNAVAEQADPDESAGDGQRMHTLAQNDDEAPEDENWEDSYPYGAFAFGNSQADIGEPGSTDKNGAEIPVTVRIPVERLGGATGRVTVRISYNPVVTPSEDGEGNLYDYAASGRSDLRLRYEDPNPICPYQTAGMPEEERSMVPAEDVAVVAPEADEDAGAEDDFVLRLSTDPEAESYRWQFRQDTGGWKDVEEGSGETMTVSFGDVWDFEAQSWTGTDFRCIYVKDGAWFCAASMMGEEYTPVAPALPMPESLPDWSEPTYSTAEFEEEYNACEFDLTFADGETVKYIEVDALDDEIPELPEMGLFTITGCEGGAMCGVCDTLTLMVSDNDAHEASQIGFEVTQMNADRADGTAYAVVRRTGGKSYNVTVEYATEDGTAKAGTDYAAASGKLSFAGSIDEVKIPIELISTEGALPGSFTLKLFNVQGGGPDDICTLSTDELTVNLNGMEKAPSETGQNLATVLAGTEAGGAGQRLNIAEDSLIPDSETTQTEVVMQAPEQTAAELVLPQGPARKSHTQAKLTFDPKDYKGENYWTERRNLLDDQVKNQGPYMEWKVTPNLTGVAPETINPLFSIGTAERDGVFGGDPSKYLTHCIDSVYPGTVSYRWGGAYPVSDYFSKYEFTAGWRQVGVAGQPYSVGILTGAKYQYLKPTVTIDQVYSSADAGVFITRAQSAFRGNGKTVHSITNISSIAPTDWTPYCTQKNVTEMEMQDPESEYRTEYWFDTYEVPLYAGFDLNLDVDFTSCYAWGDEEVPYGKIESFAEDIIGLSIAQGSQFEIREFNGTRRTFPETADGINLVIHTASDADEALATNTRLGKNSPFYSKRLTPEVSIVKGQGGVDGWGALFVGSTLEIKFPNLPSTLSVPENGVFMTNKKGERVGQVESFKDNRWTITMIWDDFTEADANDTYQLNVVYDRRQKIEIDMTPSVPRLKLEGGGTSSDIDPTKIDEAWEKFWDLDQTIDIAYSTHTKDLPYINKYFTENDTIHRESPAFVFQEPQTTSSGTGEGTGANSGHGSGSGYADGEIHYETDPIGYDDSFGYDYGDDDEQQSLDPPKDQTVKNAIYQYKGGTDSNDSRITNLQSINFNRKPEDMIMFNGRLYAGNETIYMTEDDLTAEVLTFIYYDSNYLDVPVNMNVKLDHSELYYDVDGDKQISGAMSAGMFIPDNDQFVCNLDGSYPDNTFAPYVDKDGVVHQYFIKSVFTLRPRSLKVPPGEDPDGKSQVLPAFLSAITDPAEAAALTREQQSYRYLVAANTDDHPLFGKEASAISFVDIPLGGDIGEIVHYSDSTENGIDSRYEWTPEYVGEMLVPFSDPTPIVDTDNITGGAVPIAGENPSVDEEGNFLLSRDGVDRLNASLASFTGRTTYALGVQQQVKRTPEPGSPARRGTLNLDDIKPECITLGDITSAPSPNNLMNTEGSGDAGDSSGTTPDDAGDISDFGADLGIELPSTELALGDYATIIMDGYQVGFAIGLPLAKHESSSYSGSEKNTTREDGAKVHEETRTDGTKVTDIEEKNGTKRHTETTSTQDPNDSKKRTEVAKTEVTKPDGKKVVMETTTYYEKQADGTDKVVRRETVDRDPPTPASTRDQIGGAAGAAAEATNAEKSNPFKEANSQMGTLSDFVSACKDPKVGSVSNFFKGLGDDDSLKQARNGNSTCRNFSVSLSLQAAIIFEFNPIDNCHYFKTASLAVTAGLEFKLQYRFTPFPLAYVYLKVGVQIELKISLSILRNPKEGNEITQMEDGGTLSDLSSGKAVTFELDMRKKDKTVRGFHLTLNGSVCMEVFDQKPGKDTKPVTSGMLRGDGSVSEVCFEEYDKLMYIRLTPKKGEDVTASELKPITGAASKVVFDGVNITPSLSLEVGIGVGIEICKIEAFIKTSLAITLTMGGYVEETDSYQDFYVSGVQWNVSMGINITLLFISFSIDAIGYSIQGAQDPVRKYFTWQQTASALNGSEELYSKTTYTDEAGHSIDKPPTRGVQKLAEPVDEEHSLVHVSSGPVDVSETQTILDANMPDKRALDPTGTRDFQLSGYSTSGDAKKLIGGLTTGYSYKLFTVGEDNYVIYSYMIDGVPQLVMSRIVMTGDLREAKGLVNPVNEDAETPYIKLDNDSFSDLEYDVSVYGRTVTAVWTSYDRKPTGDLSADARNVVVKRAKLNVPQTSDPKAAFSVPEIIAQDEGVYYAYPNQSGGTTVYVQSGGSADARNQGLRAFLKAKNSGLSDEIIEAGTTDIPELASAVYQWRTQSAINTLHGASSVLAASNGATTQLKDEVVENIETAPCDDGLMVLYSTTMDVYFSSTDSGAGNVDADKFTADTERGIFRSLYLRKLTDAGWGEAVPLQTVIDFDSCTSDTVGSVGLKDGIYVDNTLSGEPRVDPYFANLQFLEADLDGKGPQTVALYEMGGNTYLLRKADLDALLSGGNAQAQPIFSETSGTDVTIGSDGEHMAVVYTSPMVSSLSNAIYTAWWDEKQDCWGSPTVLAMRDLQVYEDSIKYDIDPDTLEGIYLGTGETPDGNKGSMKRLTFSDLQMSAVSVDDGKGNQKNKLLVLTQGSLVSLIEGKFLVGDPKEYHIVVEDPDQKPEVGFYAIAFGEGEQALGEGNLGLANYDFTMGSTLTGEVSFVNTGTTAIRASKANPATARLMVDVKGGGNMELLEWQIRESIPSGGASRTCFDSLPLTQTLTTGSKFYLTISEDPNYIKEGAFNGKLEDLLTVEEKVELHFGEFEASVSRIEGDTAYLDLNATVLNNGNKTAEEVFIQFSYADRNADGETQYHPVNITGSELKTGLQQEIRRRGVIREDLEHGIYMLRGDDGTTLKKNYSRSVFGTLAVPTKCFVNKDDFSGLHLKAELYSADDTPNVNDFVYASEHAEYNEINNSYEVTLKHETFFNVPSAISTALGNTLTLPVSYTSTSKNSDIIVTEISDGTPDWSPRMGLAYYDMNRNVIVAAPNSTAADLIDDGEVPTGILQIQDMATNSIGAITYQITKLGSGINIFRDDKSFRFHEPNGDPTKTDAPPSEEQAWIFETIVSSADWNGGKGTEVPMNADLSVASKAGAYVEFDTVANSITLYFSGKVSVKTTLTGKEEILTESPATIKFDNKEGARHTVTITAKQNGTALDRYTAEYVYSPILQSDSEAPQILWSRSFPDTASIQNGQVLEMVCNILDSTGLQSVTVNGKPLSDSSEIVLQQIDENWWQFTYSFRENGPLYVRAYDQSGKTSASVVNVDWFNDVLSSGASEYAPRMKAENLFFTDQAGTMIGSDPVSQAPWLKSTYKLGNGESVSAYRFMYGAFSEDELPAGSDGRWQVTANGYYLVRVEGPGGIFAQAVKKLDNLELEEPQLDVTVGVRALNITATDNRQVASVTVNGYPLKSGGKSWSTRFPIRCSGDYTVIVKDDAGNSAETTVTAELPLRVSDSGVQIIFFCNGGKITSDILVDPFGLSGGAYLPGESNPKENRYVNHYSVAVVTAGTELSSIPDSKFVSIGDTPYTFTGFEPGSYTLCLRDSSGNRVAYNRTIDVEHPDSAWKRVTYEWSEDLSSVTATRICSLDKNHIERETVRTTYSVISPASATQAGRGMYTATFKNPAFTKQSRTVTIPVASNFRFDDVKNEKAFYFIPVYWAYEHKPQITNGMDDIHFEPDTGCTRGQVVTFLWRAAGCPEPKSTKTPFKDLKKGAFYEKAVAWAVEQGITNGMTDTTFGPEGKCNRGQIVTFLWRFKNSPAPKSTATPFKDLKKGGFYVKAVAWAVENNVTKGMTDTAFAPEATCTRGQVVTFLYRAMQG